VSEHLDMQALTPEAALGLLSGSERAAILDHIDHCEQCRELMHELSAVADELALLAPSTEPPAGFEERVLAGIGVAPRRRRWPMAAAAAIAAALLVVAGFAVGRTGGTSPSVREVAMVAPTGRVVGDAYVHGDDPTWVFVAVPGWADTSTDLRLRVTFENGATTEVPGSGSWGSVLPSDAGQVRELSLIAADGKVWCSATV
jgi:hypothetical protein